MLGAFIWGTLATRLSHGRAFDPVAKVPQIEVLFAAHQNAVMFNGLGYLTGLIEITLAGARLCSYRPAARFTAHAPTKRVLAQETNNPLPKCMSGVQEAEPL